MINYYLKYQLNPKEANCQDLIYTMFLLSTVKKVQVSKISEVREVCCNNLSLS